jgi:hypothetical protein
MSSLLSAPSAICHLPICSICLLSAPSFLLHLPNWRKEGIEWKRGRTDVQGKGERRDGLNIERKCFLVHNICLSGLSHLGCGGPAEHDPERQRGQVLVQHLLRPPQNQPRDLCCELLGPSLPEFFLLLCRGAVPPVHEGGDEFVCVCVCVCVCVQCGAFAASSLSPASPSSFSSSVAERSRLCVCVCVCACKRDRAGV